MARVIVKSLAFKTHKRQEIHSPFKYGRTHTHIVVTARQQRHARPHSSSLHTHHMRSYDARPMKHGSLLITHCQSLIPRWSSNSHPPLHPCPSQRSPPPWTAHRQIWPSRRPSLRLVATRPRAASIGTWARAPGGAAHSMRVGRPGHDGCYRRYSGARGCSALLHLHCACSSSFSSALSAYPTEAAP